jgi:hypothetical protein
MSLETREMRDVNFFWDTIFIVMLVYIFFWGALCRAFATFGLRCHARIFLWDVYFENHELGLGLALFRLGTRVGPVMKKNFDLAWKFFRTFRENLGFETCSIRG